MHSKRFELFTVQKAYLQRKWMMELEKDDRLSGNKPYNYSNYIQYSFYDSTRVIGWSFRRGVQNDIGHY